MWATSWALWLKLEKVFQMVIFSLCYVILYSGTIMHLFGARDNLHGVKVFY